MKTWIAYSVFLSATLAACGGGPLDPGAGNDPGTGTSTLLVEGSANARAQIPNAAHAADFETEFSVRVSLDGQPVTTGTVTITSSSGATPLTWQPDAGNGGRWEGAANGYDEVYQLDVVSGSDKVEAVRVDGPDIHSFTAPAAGGSIDTTMATTLSWDRGGAAQLCVLHPDDVDDITIDDTGTYSIAPNVLKAEQDKAKPIMLRLTRTNEIAPDGAVAGSKLSVSVENDLDVVLLANPNA